jgi:hypothetical protein
VDIDYYRLWSVVHGTPRFLFNITSLAMNHPYRVSVIFRFCYRSSLNNVGIDQKLLTVSGETEEYVIAALAVAFPDRDCFSIVSLSWK